MPRVRTVGCARYTRAKITAFGSQIGDCKALAGGCVAGTGLDSWLGGTDAAVDAESRVLVGSCEATGVGGGAALLENGAALAHAMVTSSVARQGAGIMVGIEAPATPYEHTCLVHSTIVQGVTLGGLAVGPRRGGAVMVNTGAKLDVTSSRLHLVSSPTSGMVYVLFRRVFSWASRLGSGCNARSGGLIQVGTDVTGALTSLFALLRTRNRPFHGVLHDCVAARAGA